ncbi:MAG: hypothetical protein ACC657_05535 [Thiohalomonadales bacterium]
MEIIKNMPAKGIRIKVLKIMQEDPKVLFSVSDILNILKSDPLIKDKSDDKKYKTIDNQFRNLRGQNEIYRHIDRDINGDLQYAVTISDSKIEPFIVTPLENKIRKKGKLLIGKEIRSMFAMQFNNLAKLEDSVMRIIEEFERVEKEMDKIKHFLGKK